MIKFVLASLILSSSVFAIHPTENNRLMDIGRGTQLKVLKDMNFIPNSMAIDLGNGCAIELEKAKSYDRVLAAGTVLTIITTYDTYNSYYQSVHNYLYVDNKNISFIYCETKDYSDPTIGQLKSTNAFEIKLAEPQKI